MSIVVDGPRKRRFKPDEVRATLHCGNIVHIAEDVLGERVVILQSNFHIHIFPVPAEIDRMFVQRIPVLLQIFHELNQSAFVMEFLLRAIAFVHKDELHHRIQEGKFPDSLQKNFTLELDLLEDGLIRQKVDFRPRFFSFADDLQLRHRLAILVALVVDLSVAVDFNLQPLRKCIDHRNTNAVKSTGNLVALFVELSAGVKCSEYHFDRRFFLSGMNVHGNTAAVVNYGYAVVFVQNHLDFGAKSGHRLVDTVVYHLVDKVV